MKTFKDTLKKLAVTLVLTMLCFAGCGDNPVETTGNLTDKNQQASFIKVSISDCNGLKLYGEELPLIYVQQLREVTTNNNGNFIFSFEIPDGYELLFESETMSFSSIENGYVVLNWQTNTNYQFAITTK